MPSPVNTDLEVKVTKIKNRWHTRLLIGDKVLDEMACNNSLDIGYCCRTMLRWHNKCGGQSPFAISARSRLNAKPHHIVGRIWYSSQVDELKAKNAKKKP